MHISVIASISEHLGVAFGTTLFSQPVKPLRAGLQGFEEMLLRVRDARGEWRSPQEFLAQVDNHQFSWLVDRDVIISTLKYLRAHPEKICSVNVSAQSLNKGSNLANFLVEMLTKEGVAPDRLIVEISENALLDSGSNGERLFHQLREDVGVGIAFDDFGTRALNFKDLRLSPDFLKIDIDYVKQAVYDHRPKSIVAALIELARTHSTKDHRIRTVAEGVETEEVYDLIVRMGCDYAQGWCHRLGVATPIEL